MFDEFNWHNFEYGDIVWTEDCEEVDALCCYFVNSPNSLYNESGFVELRKVDNKVALFAIKHSATNIAQII